MDLVVNLRSGRYDVYIGRPGKWGNPFVIGKDGTRDEVIEKYRQWLWNRIKSGEVELNDLISLEGKVLGCFCKPQACHGDVLVRAIEWAKAEDTIRREIAMKHDHCSCYVSEGFCCDEHEKEER